MGFFYRVLWVYSFFQDFYCVNVYYKFLKVGGNVWYFLNFLGIEFFFYLKLMLFRMYFENC